MSQTSKQGTLFFEHESDQHRHVKPAAIRATSQNRIVLEFFQKYPDQKFTPMQVWLQLVKKNKALLLGSVRRTMSMLTKMELLIHDKTYKKRQEYGYTNTHWQLKINEEWQQKDNTQSK